MRLRDSSILSYLKIQQRRHQFCRNTFTILVKYIAYHQAATVYDESIDFLLQCKAQGLLPKFLEMALSHIPYTRNRHVSTSLASLRRALLDACIAERKQRRAQCIRGITSTRSFLQERLNTDVWRAISDRNQVLCLRIRERERRKLQEKIAFLRSQVHIRSQHFISPDAVPPRRCTVIGTDVVDEDMEALLNLGPSFAISTPVNQEVMDSVQCAFHKFAHQIRWRENSAPTVLDRLSSFAASIPFPRTSVIVPKPVPALEPTLASLQLNLVQIYANETSAKYASNLTAQERRGLKKLLLLKNDLRYSVSDKSGDFVVLTQSTDKSLGRKSLSDSMTYETSSLQDFGKVSDELRSTTTRILSKVMDRKTARRFVLTYPMVPTYYALVKTHKFTEEVDLRCVDEDSIKVRPIISSCGGPSDRVSWLLTKLLSPLLQHVAAHLVNAGQFIAALDRCEIPDDSSYASFDAVSLYTNVDSREAINSVIELLRQHHDEVHTFGLMEEDIRELLSAILKCNIFRFDSRFYSQKRGLAMGLRISPLLAIVYLDRIERRSLITGIVFYKRYIDDVFVVSSTANAMGAMLQNLNSCDPNIRFTVEHPDERGFLPFLNTKVRIIHGTKEVEWYKKPMSKNILLHSRSAHPLYMKANVIRNLIATKTRTCTRESEEVDRRIAKILEENGYTTIEPRTWRPFFANEGVPLVLPYVNERIAKKVNHTIKSSHLPVKLVFRPPENLRSLLTSSRIYEEKCGRSSCSYCTENKICQLRGTVYLVTCEGCSRRYVGETMRPLYIRMDEHVRALRNPSSYPKSGFSRHRTMFHQHEAPPRLKVTVLHRSKDSPLERKLLEAIAIKRLSPEINNRDELMEAMRLIA